MRELRQVIVKEPPSSARSMMWLAISLTLLALGQVVLLIWRVVS